MPTPLCTHSTATRLVVRPGGDRDADRNVSNAVYLEDVHQARLEHLTRLEMYAPRDPHSANLFALAENTCRYLAPSYYGDVLLIWTATHAVARSSFQLVYRVWRESDEVLIAAAHSVQVWLDQHHRPTPLPSSVREALTTSLCPELPKLPVRDEPPTRTACVWLTTRDDDPTSFTLVRMTVCARSLIQLRERHLAPACISAFQHQAPRREKYLVDWLRVCLIMRGDSPSCPRPRRHPPYRTRATNPPPLTTSLLSRAWHKQTWRNVMGRLRFGRAVRVAAFLPHAETHHGKEPCR
jgi:YbgC/YbaW family acyl-CoA thioester hydrolase